MVTYIVVGEEASSTTFLLHSPYYPSPLCSISGLPPTHQPSFPSPYPTPLTIPFGPSVDLMRSPIAVAPTNEDYTIRKIGTTRTQRAKVTGMVLNRLYFESCFAHC